MREIKFRAWDYQNNRWADDNDVEGSIRLNFCLKDYFINKAGEKALRFSFTQYTGLKDMYGVDIYEGDIVNGTSGNKAQIIFEDGCFLTKNETGSTNYITMPNYFEVINNIYENLELLK